MSGNFLNAVLLLSAAGYNAASVTPVTSQQSTSNPYGYDLSCIDDLDPSMIEVGGNLVLAQACARRLLTPNGTLLDDADYGYDLTQWIDADLDPADAAEIQVAIAQELQKDERVSSATCLLTYTQATSVITAQITIDGAAGPFQFVLTVSALAAILTMVT